MNNQSWTRILSFALILFSAFFAAGQSGSKANALDGGPPDTVNAQSRAITDYKDPAFHKRAWRYTIHGGDTLELTFMSTPELNQTVTVQPDGYITLRDVGDLIAGGQTLPELTESIKKAYAKVLRDPVVSVEAKDFEKPYYVVGGQVGRPGKFDWRGEVTLTQAIEIAGGFTDAAKHSQVLMFRRVSDQWAEAKLINVKQMLRTGNLSEDPIVQPGDMLIVPKNAMSKIKPYLPIPTLGLYSSQF